MRRDGAAKVAKRKRTAYEERMRADTLAEKQRADQPLLALTISMSRRRTRCGSTHAICSQRKCSAWCDFDFKRSQLLIHCSHTRCVPFRPDLGEECHVKFNCVQHERAAFGTKEITARYILPMKRCRHTETWNALSKKSKRLSCRACTTTNANHPAVYAPVSTTHGSTAAVEGRRDKWRGSQEEERGEIGRGADERAEYWQDLRTCKPQAAHT